MIDNWKRIVDEGDEIGPIYMDFRKAFDKLTHQRLLKKLAANGLDSDVLRWMEAFLEGRKQSTGEWDILGMERGMQWDSSGQYSWPRALCYLRQ